MSAYVVSTATMDRAVAAILSVSDHLRHIPAPALATLARGPQGLGEALYALNSRQVLQRYPDETDLAKAPKWTYRAKLPVGAEGLKALDSLLYQCSEGDCDQQPLYRELCAARDNFGCELARKRPDYERAPWD